MIYYLANYDSETNSLQERRYSPAATSKTDYLLDVMARNGYRVEVVSMCNTEGRRFVRSKKYSHLSGASIRLFSSLPRSYKLINGINYFWMFFQALLYLLRNLRKEDVLFVYHSLTYYYLVKILTILRRCPLILQVEEIYSDVSNYGQQKRREKSYLPIADAYVFPTELLNKAVNTAGKPFAIAHGNYKVEKIVNLTNDSKIHVVYAGVFDPRKGGAMAAIAAAEYLDSEYHMHIIGFGSDQEKQDVVEKINEVREKTTCSITFDGRLSGSDYVMFLQSCAIGLSCQNPEGSYNSSSFPSKVLSYMANGLHVVSIRIDVLEQSGVNDLITYYDKQDACEIAKAIRSVDFRSPYDSRLRIAQLDAAFVADFSRLMTETCGY